MLNSAQSEVKDKKKVQLKSELASFAIGAFSV